MIATPRKDKGLSIRQKRFVEEYLVDCNGTRAAIAAGYSKKGADVAAVRLLGNARVCADLDRRRASLDMGMELTTERILREVARLSYFDSRKLYRDDGTLKKPHEWDDDTAAAVGSVEIKEVYEGTGAQRRLVGYTTHAKPFDKNSALEKALRHKGLYKRDNDQIGNAIARAIIVPAKGSIPHTADQVPVDSIINQESKRPKEAKHAKRG